MRLRWIQRRRKITVASVRKYAEKYGLSFLDAKKSLSNYDTRPTLQYRTWYGVWRDVEFITEYFE